MKFQVNWPFGSGEKFIIDIQHGGSGNHLGIPIGTILVFFIYKYPRYFISSFKFGLSVQDKQYKIDFQDGDCGSHLEFLIGKISVIFYLQVIPILPMRFPVNWHFSSGEDVQNRFSRWLPSWISNQKDFSYFLSADHTDISYQVSSQLAFQFKRRNFI